LIFPGALRVRLYSGTLSSAELLAVLNGANVAAIGTGSACEVIQFAEATLVEAQVYELRCLLRGQAGTDGLMPDNWPAGTQFVLLDRAVGQIDLPLVARGLDRHYRVGAAERGYDDASVVHSVRAFEGVGLRPYSPAHLRAVMLGDGGLGLSWIRRTRIDGDGWQYGDVPLGEDREAYLVRVLVGGAVIREVTVDAPGWTYSGANRTLDGALAGCELRVAQVSDRFGPGPFAKVTI
jgi:hypothetical protein